MCNKQEITATIFDKRGRILAVGKNSYDQSHPRQAYYAAKVGDPKKIYLHAEIAALIKCKGNPYKIKIERYNKQGEPRLAKPCPICELAIKEAGISFVEYTVG